MFEFGNKDSDEYQKLKEALEVAVSKKNSIEDNIYNLRQIVCCHFALQISNHIFSSYFSKKTWRMSSVRLTPKSIVFIPSRTQ